VIGFRGGVSRENNEGEQALLAERNKDAIHDGAKFATRKHIGLH